VRVDDGRQVDLAIFYGLLQHWSNPAMPYQYRSALHRCPGHLLWWVCRVDDDRVFGFVIDDEVGVVVGTTNPCFAIGNG